ncbi:MAG: glycosyltransferase family 4 protein, partial [Chloroflexi bacterium]|nr:glycosyltransferase family 4 protein [Chloroflexota bacterium]
VPNGVDATKYRVLPEQGGSKEILFIGKMDYAPNVDGALYFYHEVFPLIRQALPEARLLVVGSNPAPLVKALAADPAVEVTGYVEDVVPYYERARLSVVPLRAGSGTRLKILEAMALGRPVLSTTVGCEGLAVTPEADILIADTARGLAEQTIRLLTDLELGGRLAANARLLVESRYDWQVIGRTLLQVYDSIAASNNSRGRRLVKSR